MLETLAQMPIYMNRIFRLLDLHKLPPFHYDQLAILNEMEREIY